jgi:hypothetical protein
MRFSPFYGSDDALIMDYIRQRPERRKFLEGPDGDAQYAAAVARYADTLARISKSMKVNLRDLPGGSKTSSEGW